MKLDLLRYAQAVVQQLREAIAAARPRLDVELEQLAVRRPELDLARFEVPGQSRQSKRPRCGAGHPHRPVPRPRHPHHELVVQPEAALVAPELLKGGELARRCAVRVSHDLGGQLLRREPRARDSNAVVPVEMRTGAVLRCLQVLALDRVRKRRRGVLCPGSLDLVAVQGGRAPQVAPGRQCHTERPAGCRGQAARKRGSAHGHTCIPDGSAGIPVPW